MSEIGTVIEINGEKAVVEFNRTEACAKCRACMAGFKESKMILEAQNDAEANTGDLVFVELPQYGLLSASVIMYLFPMASMIAGFLGGMLLAPRIGIKEDIAAFCFGIGLLLLSFLIVRLNEKKFKSLSMFVPHIVKIVN